jgi:hypothetical protein
MCTASFSTDANTQPIKHELPQLCKSKPVVLELFDWDDGTRSKG